MNAMKTTSAMQIRMLRFSVAIYKRLLVLYPQSFRREYGHQMLQVFRDCSREAEQTSGSPGLWRYWALATGDLIISALAERQQEVTHMTRTRWISLGSLAAIFGGGVAVLFTALQLIVAIAQLLDEQSVVGSALFPTHIVIWAAPALWLLYILALIGLQAVGADRMGIVGWVSITIAIVGAALSGLGGSVTSALQYSQAASCASPLNCNFHDPSGFAIMGYMLGLLGSVFFTIGMTVYGIVALRRSLFAQGNWIPLVLGLAPLVLVAASIVAAFVSAGTDYAGFQKIEIMLGAASLVPAILWVLLGLAMRRDGHGETAMPPVSPAPVEPTVS